MAKPTIAQAAKAADDFLALKAAQAELAKKEEALKKVLLAFGKDVVEGKVARVTISTVPGRESVNMAELRKIVPAKVLSALTKIGKPSVRFAAKARLTKPETVAA